MTLPADALQVATWGMFPRPDNISKAYGGGRTIKPGEVAAPALPPRPCSPPPSTPLMVRSLPLSAMVP